jgi:hypothetical protein
MMKLIAMSALSLASVMSVAHADNLGCTSNIWKYSTPGAGASASSAYAVIDSSSNRLMLFIPTTADAEKGLKIKEQVTGGKICLAGTKPGLTTAALGIPEVSNGDVYFVHTVALSDDLKAFAKVLPNTGKPEISNPNQ